MLGSLLVQPPLDEALVADRSAQDHHAAFVELALSDPGLAADSVDVCRFFTSCVPDFRLPQVDLDASVAAQGGSHQGEDLFHALGVAEDVDIVEVREDQLARAEGSRDLAERCVLPQGVEGRHQRVSLFAAFSLHHGVRLAPVVVPDVFRLLGVEEPHEWQQRPQVSVVVEGAQH